MPSHETQSNRESVFSFSAFLLYIYVYIYVYICIYMFLYMNIQDGFQNIITPNNMVQLNKYELNTES